MSIIENLKNGNKLFRKYHLQEFKEELDYSIINGQKPEVLLISCCDSRITTDFMFGNKPGDLFVVRNIGNFVPPHNDEGDFYSVAAAIEYAVDVLGVSNIIVCGHSNCGACESLYKDIPSEYKGINKWLEIAKPIKDLTLQNGNLYASPEELYKATEQNSVVFQLNNLLTYPTVRQRVAKNELSLHGWWYNLSDGSIHEYNKEIDKFEEIN